MSPKRLPVLSAMSAGSGHEPEYTFGDGEDQLTEAGAPPVSSEDGQPLAGMDLGSVSGEIGSGREAPADPEQEAAVLLEKAALLEQAAGLEPEYDFQSAEGGNNPKGSRVCTRTTLAL